MILQVLLAIFFVLWSGVPLAIWLSRESERSVFRLISHSLVCGLLTVGLVSQVCWKLDWNAHQAVFPFLGLVSALNFLLGLRLVWPHRTKLVATEFGSLISICLVAVAMLSVYAINNGEPYYGRAWGDQINYSLLANFFQHQSADSTLPYTQPAELLVINCGLLNDRIGQSILHAWISEITGAPALDSYYFVCVIGAITFTAVIYLISRSLDITPYLSTLLAIGVGLSPPFQTILLESFLSQTVVTPYVFYAALGCYHFIETSHRSWLVVTFLTAVWTLTSYFEFFPVLVVATLSVMGLTLRLERKKMYHIFPVLGALSFSVLLASWLSTNPLKLMMRAGSARPGFEEFYPWAYEAEGQVRLWVGDWAIHVPNYLMSVLAIAVVGITAWSVIHLLIFARQRPNSLALSLASLILVPFGVLLFPGDYSYQFYKLLQSFWPASLVAIMAPSPTTSQSFAHLGTKIRTCLFHFSLPILVAATLAMLVKESQGQSTRSGLTSYLQQHGSKTLDVLVGSRREQRIIVSMPSRRHWNDLWVNGVVSLQLSPHFKYIQSKWVHIGEHQHYQPVSEIVPPDPGIIDVRSIQPEFLDNLDTTLVLQIGSGFIEPAERVMSQVSSAGRLKLYKTNGQHWLIATSVIGPYPGAFMGNDQGITVGGHPDQFLRLDLESSSDLPDGVGLEVHFEAPEDFASFEWHVYSNLGYGTFVHSDNHILQMNSGPLRRGVTQIFFGPRFNDRPDLSNTPLEAKITRIIYGL